ncbi:cation transporter [Pseudonocardia sp. S2-4]|uniref:Cation transporter n=1 Tax=Pseudonocardia humida TaxID=2800819 RepID=A0ABT1A4Q5_9PSEU|nr:cation transporter [Pseudonocardia humida]
MAGDRQAVLRRRVRLLVAATITYNVIEAVVALVAGTIAGSIALIGFGLDSVIEVSSAAAVAWQFAARTPDRIAHRERTALRIIAWSFFALAAYVTVESARTLLALGLGLDLGLGPDGGPDHSPVGIVLVAVSVAVMPVLSLVQRRTGRELGSASAVADSRQTLLCTYLSIAVLVGLVLNAAVGWWWADPVAGLVLAALAVREGSNALRGDTCCAPVHLTAPAPGHGGDRRADDRRLALTDDDPTKVEGADGRCGCASGCTAPCCAPAGERSRTTPPDRRQRRRGFPTDPPFPPPRPSPRDR